MIRIVDYGVGNIQAFMTMFRRLGVPAERARTAQALAGSTRLILPGVGAFDHAMQLLNDSGMRPALESMVLGQEVPVLGVCVGMQMLASGSDEGALDGLNWVPGRVRAFAATPQSADLPMPHMGWNDLQVRDGAALYGRGFDEAPQFYFLHSYYFDAAISRGHIHGVQCHPEKSHHWGAQLLKNFSEL